MRGLPLEPAARFRRALFPSRDNQFGWRLASVIVSFVLVAFIALTLGYRLRGAELPAALLVGLLAAFATWLNRGRSVRQPKHLRDHSSRRKVRHFMNRIVRRNS